MTTNDPRTVSDLSEDDLTARFGALFGPAPSGEVWTGDDAAVIATGERAVMTTDVVTEHVDFEFDWARGTDVGFKLVAVNVSDIAAMGAIPTRAVATLNVRTDLGLDVVEGIVAGMKQACERWGVDIVGGDVGRASEVSMSLALLGELDGEAILRSGARVGDAICVTGTLGGAAGGLLALQAGAVDPATVHAEIDSPTGANGLAVMAARQLRPQARLEESRVVRRHATAMIDISDGFALDLYRLLSSSGAGCVVDDGAIPIDPELAVTRDRLPEPSEPLVLALTGGEDFELLFTVPLQSIADVTAATDEVGTSVTVVGRVTDGEQMTIGTEPLERWSTQAWDHLRSR